MAGAFLMPTARALPLRALAARRARGQSATEFLIVLPVLILLLLGVLQFGLLYQARSVVNHATFLAARAGSLAHGSGTAMRQAFAAGMLPLFTHAPDAAGLATARATAATESAAPLTTFRLLNPTPAAMGDFGVARLDGQAGREIPNDTLVYRKSTLGATSGLSVQDANLLQIQVRYCFPLVVPLWNTLIVAMSGGAAQLWPGAGPGAPVGGPSSCQRGAGMYVPILSQAIVRMQTSFQDENL
jgi:hypothetical protein